jgi:hypothetical protein
MKEEITDSDDIDYYTKVYLLGMIHGPIPVGANTGAGSVFLSPNEVSKLPERGRIRTRKEQ